MTSKYRVALYPIGSDNPFDNLRRVVAPVNTTLMMVAPRMTGNAWHRIDLAFGADHSMAVKIDGQPHMTSGPDAMLAGPFDLMFDWFKDGAIDNVLVYCER